MVCQNGSKLYIPGLTNLRSGLKTFGRGLGKPFESEWKKHKARLEEDLDNIRLYAQAAEANAARRREEERVEEHKSELNVSVPYP